MSELQDQYRLLDVPVDVSLATLKQAYKDLVLVWHPDRFSDHPRLQKKAEEKLKCINLAYQEISALHRGENFQVNSSQTTHAKTAHTEARSQHKTRQQNRHKGPRGTRHSQKRHQGSNSHQSKRQKTCSTKNCDSSITLRQASFILSNFDFRPIQRTDRNCKHFKSGPFRLEINVRDNRVILENLCDSINGFHPILLTIPCKASGLFSGIDAQELITLFKNSQSRPL